MSMNFIKIFLCMSLVVTSCSRSVLGMLDWEKIKNMDPLSVKFKIKNGMYVASVREKPSLLRQVFGLKGSKHEVKVPTTITMDRSTDEKKFYSCLDNSQFQHTATLRKDGEDFLKCCIACIEACCGNSEKKD